MSINGRLPGHHHRAFRVTTALPSGKTVRGDDGMPLKEWSETGDLLQRVTYVGDLERLDGRWSLVLQWVDLDNNGHRIALPHEVVEHSPDPRQQDHGGGQVRPGQGGSRDPTS